MTDTKTTIDLGPWCALDESRGLDKPYVQNGRKYASDLRSAIWVEATGEPDGPAPSPRRPDVANAFAAWFPADAKWEPIPLATGAVMEEGDCPDCRGSGRIGTLKCEGCDGAGEIECGECGHIRECNRCDGDGAVGGSKCLACKGAGARVREDHIRFGKLCIAWKYYQMIAVLPNAKWAPGDKKVCVQFDGGQAMAMVLDIEKGAKR